MKTKKQLINKVLELEQELYEISSKEDIVGDLSEWFDIEVNLNCKEKTLLKLFNDYLDELYSCLLGYSIEELEDRIEGLEKTIAKK